MKQIKIFFYSLLILFLVTHSSQMSRADSLENNKTMWNLKTFFEDGYDKLWRKVDSLQSKGLPQSAIDVVKEIYEKAKKEENAGQFIKAVIHKVKFRAQVEENALIKSIDEFKTEAEQANAAVKPILYSMLADAYWQYYQNNRWRFAERTTVVDFKQEDISTWDLRKITEETLKYYLLSLKDPENLQKIKIDVYDEVIQKGYEKQRKQRPTLYDFLAHRAIDFLMNTETELTKPVYEFTLNNADYLKPAAEFVNIKITTKDMQSFKFYGITILQDLLRFRLKDNNPEALVDADLKRLSFVYNRLITDNKEALYLDVLQKLEQSTINSPISTEVTYYIANIYYAKGQTFVPKKAEENKWMLKKAIEICEAGIKRFPGADGSTYLQSLISTINAKAMEIQVEDINVIQKTFLASLNYKNIDKLYWRIVKMSGDELARIQNKNWENDKWLTMILEKPVLQQWDVTIPDEKDFQYHRIELKIPALPAGEYVILASHDPNFSIENNAFAYTATTISNLSYFDRTNRDGTSEFYVLDRQTGNPLAGVNAEVWYNQYNYKRYEYERIKGPVLSSNSEGYVLVPYKKDASFSIDFSYKEDKLTGGDNFSSYEYGNEKYTSTRTTFFTDRAIYRPGQTIYFKGITLQTDGEKHEILPNHETTVILYDVNSQKVAELVLKSNEYGTFSGTFLAPDKGLNGLVRIQNEWGNVYISVEDYKRPKFEVSFNPIKVAYKLGDEIKAIGTAKAYSGANIDGAEVKYRVVRAARFPYWWYYWYGYYPTSPELEILSGATKTNEKGEFEVNFKAIPDLSVSKESEPTFTYTIYADVTDLNGETRSSTGYVSVGYKALQVSIDIDAELDKNEKQELKINSSNLSGEFEAAKGSITIQRLKSPEKVFTDRRWSNPDRYLYSKADYEKDFPYFSYEDEDNKLKWEKAEKVLDISFDTEKEKTLLLDKISTWIPGQYILEIKSKDKYGEEVKNIYYFIIYAKNSKKLAVTSLDYFNPIKSTVEPGEKAAILIGTSDQNLNILYEIEHKGLIVQKKWLKMTDEQELFEILIEEIHRGNIVVYASFVRNNRFYAHSQVINVPWSNKQLDITFETFRNKLNPGQEEEWKIKIKGPNGDKVAAEMVATLYDASLDAFKPNNFFFSLYNSYYATKNWSANDFNANSFQIFDRSWNEYVYTVGKSYDYLNWFNVYFYDYGYGYLSGGEYELDDVKQERSISVSKSVAGVSPKDGEDIRELKKEEAAEQKRDEPILADTEKVVSRDQTVVSGKTGIQDTDVTGVQVRTNFNETAFFYPHLQTNEEGDIIIKFTIPEALTKWKMLGFAHTKDLKYGYATNSLVTQKDLMVVPNAPRFFRESDKIAFSSKITNISEKDLKGTAQLYLIDAITQKAIDVELGNNNASQSFETLKGQSTALVWNISIPAGISAITYRIIAKADNFSDGEEMVIPVLTNSMLVTETMPLPIRSNQTKTFVMDKLVASNNASSTLRNHKLTLEFTSNPAWYAVQALPYLMEFPYECAEQTFSRFYSNSIASHIANSSPKIKEVFDSWKNETPDALLSNLEKNQELKSVFLEETPWVLQAQSETQRKHNIGVLFEVNKMARELDKALEKLIKKQVSNGAWTWFEGMPDDRYITQHIVTGMGHLDHLGVKLVREDNRAWDMTRKAVGYLDRQIHVDYEDLKRLDKRGDIKLSDDHLGYFQIQYLYARSFFKDLKVDKNYEEAVNYFMGQAKKYWLNKNKYAQGMISLALYRNEDLNTPKDIVKSLREKSLNSEEMGMYWKEGWGYYWYEMPIETQALMIEVFDEVAQDTKAVDDLKTWLLKQKQTQDWKTTKATTEACYALLLKGSNWLTSDKQIEITIGNQTINPYGENNPFKVEAGTGYFKTSWESEKITADMGKITVAKKDEGVSWGAVYWQYFEQLDKITAAETPLKLQKKLFLQINSDTGPVLTPIDENTVLKVGDLVKVRIELRVDRAMEYVHMKDMRASAFEPLNVISQYKWQDGLGYYESTRDAATHFFFSYLPKGTFVFEYPLRITHEGNFSNGISTIQCMYAPEFTSHSEGVRVKVGK